MGPCLFCQKDLVKRYVNIFRKVENPECAWYNQKSTKTRWRLLKMNITRKLHSLERVRKRCRMDTRRHTPVSESIMKKASSGLLAMQKCMRSSCRSFMDDPSCSKNLDQAMKDKDYGTAFTAAHTLKGITGNLSMNELL
jgi:hypothetical protein